jgi:hypothetical protein
LAIQHLDREVCVADHGYRRWMRATDHAGVHVDVNQPAGRFQLVIRTVHSRLKARADRERHVRSLERSGHCPTLVQIADGQRMPLLNRTASIDSGDDRRAEPLRELDERFAGPGRNHAAAGDDDAPPGLLQQFDRRGQRGLIDTIRLRGRRNELLIADVGVLQVNRNLDRARLAAAARHLCNDMRQQRCDVARFARTLDRGRHAAQHLDLFVRLVHVAETAAVETRLGLPGDQ